jgi:hypothetical protein
MLLRKGSVFQERLKKENSKMAAKPQGKSSKIK